MQFPDNVISASFQPVPGWTRTVKMAQLDEPIEGEDGPITEKIDSVTWSGGEIKPGEFQEFGVSFQVPEDAAGSSLVFPAVQTYSSGEVVRWIGDESADEPAPAVAVLAAASEEEAPPATDTTARETAPTRARPARRPRRPTTTARTATGRRRWPWSSRSSRSSWAAERWRTCCSGRAGRRRRRRIAGARQRPGPRSAFPGRAIRYNTEREPEGAASGGHDGAARRT